MAVAVLISFLGCKKDPPPVAAPPLVVTGVAPGSPGTWGTAQRTSHGVRPIENPPPPSESCSTPRQSQENPKRLELTQPAAKEDGCGNVGVLPDEAQYTKALAALAAEPATQGVFEVELLPNGCAVLVEWRSQGEVQRWEFRRQVKGRLMRVITWDFDSGVKRPSTVHRFAFAVGLDRYGEWEKDEVHRKTFVSPDDPKGRELVYTHYRGEKALYAHVPDARAPERISSNVPTFSCRNDGSNHCDKLEEQAWWRFGGSPY